MTIRSQLGSVRRGLLSSFSRRRVSLADRGPIITFTFDDFPRSAATVGAPILESFGIRGTYYVSMGLMGRENDLGKQFREADLSSLVKRGHEIGSHTFTHSSARQTAYADFEADFERGRRALLEVTGGSAENFAYPFGDVTAETKRKLGPQVKSSRGTFPGINGPTVDLNLLRGNRLYGGIESAKQAKELILDNERRRGWLIFYTHDVAANPSKFGCTPALLETACSLAWANSNRILTVSEVINELQPESALCEKTASSTLDCYATPRN